MKRNPLFELVALLRVLNGAREEERWGGGKKKEKGEGALGRKWEKI